MLAQEFASFEGEAPDPAGQGMLGHAVIDTEHHGLEPLPLGLVALFSRYLGNGTDTFGEPEVGIGLIVLHHTLVTREGRSDADSLAHSSRDRRGRTLAAAG